MRFSPSYTGKFTVRGVELQIPNVTAWHQIFPMHQGELVIENKREPIDFSDGQLERAVLWGYRREDLGPLWAEYRAKVKAGG